MKTVIIFGLTGGFLRNHKTLRARLAQVVGGERDDLVIVHLVEEVMENEALVPDSITCSYLLFNSGVYSPGSLRDVKTDIEAVIETHCRNCKPGIKVVFNGLRDDVAIM